MDKRYKYLYMKYQSATPYSLKVGQKVKVKVTRSTVMVSTEIFWS